ncbi:hypothetical protein QTO34_000263 [Cnephaeus nilssonii]|uniref:Uncharacterized protein n=1 Tax=Cnephaeus nilssonii TaxID=3371016 RepID=A0AA40IC73_CNENI|nr:hypothetical protein QTO34_000263 [Eptesicus nilssonii]
MPRFANRRVQNMLIYSISRKLLQARVDSCNNGSERGTDQTTPATDGSGPKQHAYETEEKQSKYGDGKDALPCSAVHCCRLPKTKPNKFGPALPLLTACPPSRTRVSLLSCHRGQIAVAIRDLFFIPDEFLESSFKAFQKPPPSWRLLKGLVHQQTAPSSPAIESKSMSSKGLPNRAVLDGGSPHAQSGHFSAAGADMETTPS